LARKDAGLRWLDEFGCCSKLAEIRGIEGKQSANSIRQHGRNDIHVMHLTAGGSACRKEVDEMLEPRWSIIRNLKCLLKSAYIRNRRSHWHDRGARLRPCYDSEVLAEHLRAYPEAATFILQTG
jgi:hypothetical protein